MTINELRSKRIAGEIPAIMLAAKAKKNRSRLSAVECGHVTPTEEDLERLRIALEQLIQARSAIREAAVAAGWPGTSVAR